MAKKFNTIIESYMRTYQNNSLVVGDRVKFIDNYTTHDWIKSQPAVKLERIKDLVESGDFIRISAVKTVRPHTAESGHFEVIDDIYYDIVREAAPGLYTQVFTVPQNILVLEDDYPNISGPTPDNQIKADPSEIKPGEAEAPKSGSPEMDHQLLGKNVDISIEEPAKSYTAKYLQG